MLNFFSTPSNSSSRQDNAIQAQLQTQLALQEEKIRHLQSQLKSSFFIGASDFPGFTVKFSSLAGQLRDARIEFASPGVTQYLKLTPGMLQKQPILGLMSMSAFHQRRFQRLLMTSAAHLQTFSLDVELTDGAEPRWLSLTVSPRVFEGRFIWECLALDITETQKAKEAALRANHEKLMFLSKLSHLLRTPLNSIMGYTQLISQSEQLKDSVHSDVQAILQSCGQLSQILNDVFDASMLELDMFEVFERDIDLQSLLREISDSYRTQASDKGLVFDTRFDIAPLMVRTDPVRLKQALGTLLTNAFQYTSTGKITFQAQSQQSDGRLHVTFEVLDTGNGIEPARLAMLLQPGAPFAIDADEQDDAEVKVLAGGLQIASRIATKLGGTLGAQSKPGEGSAFSLRLSLPARQVEAISASVETPSTEPMPQRSLHVLVVDDSRTNRSIIKNFLQKQGHRVDEAANGVEAVELMPKLVPDLVFMDLDMPEMDGIEASRVIRGLSSSASQTFITAMTGQVFETDKENALAAGMNDFITKPVNFRQVERVLATFQGR